MRLIDTTPFDVKFIDIPDGTEDYKQGYIDGARHVLEEMDEAPTVDAVPLDKLCEWLEDNAALTDGVYVSAKEWKRELTLWMEEQNE
jgi:hypothetical protein